MIPDAFTINVLEHGARRKSPQSFRSMRNAAAKGGGFVEVLFDHVLVGYRNVRSDGSWRAVLGQARMLLRLKVWPPSTLSI